MYLSRRVPALQAEPLDSPLEKGRAPKVGVAHY